MIHGSCIWHLPYTICKLLPRCARSLTYTGSLRAALSCSHSGSSPLPEPKANPLLQGAPPPTTKERLFALSAYNLSLSIPGAAETMAAAGHIPARKSKKNSSALCVAFFLRFTPPKPSGYRPAQGPCPCQGSTGLLANRYFPYPALRRKTRRLLYKLWVRN